jgi:phosphate:Na+ symporter
LRRKKEANVYFSDAAMDEIRDMAADVAKMLDFVLKVFDDLGSISVQNACSLRKRIKDVRIELKKRHVRRLSSGECTVIAGLLFIDIISCFDRVGGLCMEIVNDQLGAK